MSDARSDAQLLSAVRAGDASSYAVLWRRHATAAHRHAQRLFPERADDLVSEAFLAIYVQVTRSSKGPQFAFRSYLKAVLRNTAIRWRRESERFQSSEHLDQVDPRDGLSVLEQRASSADVAEAFGALPERWQRVLWLAEVAELGRPEIAKDLGIRPNAVSALQRRARAGLKFQWLSRQIPPALRDDADHVARLIPQYLTEPNNVALGLEVTTHVGTCAVCGELLRSTRGGAARLQGRTLAVLLGSAGVAIPGAASLSSGTAAAAAVLGVTGWLAASGVGIVAVGGITLASLYLGAVPQPGVIDTSAAHAAESPSGPTSGADPAPDASAGVDGAGEQVSESPATPELPTGRRVDDPTVPSAGLSDDPDQEFPTAPTRPRPVVVSVPGPGTGSGTAVTPGVIAPAASTGYVAPVLTGRATPGSTVAVAVDSQTYAPTPAADGSWSMDLRGLQLGAGEHEYRVWAFDENTQSAATVGRFTVVPVQVRGFEQITGFEDMLVEEARTTGVVVAFTGPPGGSIFVTTMQGLSATIPLDENGTARRRLLMDAVGWYHFTIRSLDSEGFWGPPVEEPVDVYDPDVIFGPWGPDPDDMTFTFVDP